MIWLFPVGVVAAIVLLIIVLDIATGAELDEITKDRGPLS